MAREEIIERDLHLTQKVAVNEANFNTALCGH